MYLGSKNRISKQLLPILKEARGDRTWVEPFVGGANMIDKIEGERYGNDYHPQLIELLRAVRDGWIPPTEVSRDLYYEVKNNPEKYPPRMVGFVGFLCSFGGKWWGGYAKNSKGTNYAAAAHRSLLKQAPNLNGVKLRCGSYLSMIIPPNSLIYCDPPYANTTKYSISGFNHQEFWEWCRRMSSGGNKVFVSEYTAPEDFKCLKVVETSTALNKNHKSVRIEKLFTLKEGQ